MSPICALALRHTHSAFEARTSIELVGPWRARAMYIRGCVMRDVLILTQGVRVQGTPWCYTAQTERWPGTGTHGVPVEGCSLQRGRPWLPLAGRCRVGGSGGHGGVLRRTSALVCAAFPAALAGASQAGSAGLLIQHSRPGESLPDLGRLIGSQLAFEALGSAGPCSPCAVGLIRGGPTARAPASPLR